ncbi:Tn3 family transposase [Paraburkholderia nodosa]|uniref:Tn3 family transposase n=1 Tax=Paraburkholderia nodosa TaxID=392320 RepID=UPI0012B6A230|nr:Tn3 family transposase [Paraburkholderia nodosa]
MLAFHGIAKIDCLDKTHSLPKWFSPRHGQVLPPQLQRNVHRSQNRIEAYHALRGFIAEVSGRKHLIGKTDHDIAINNECGRLLANVVTAFNGSDVMDDSRPSGLGICQSGEVVTSTAKERSS